MSEGLHQERTWFHVRISILFQHTDCPNLSRVESDHQRLLSDIGREDYYCVVHNAVIIPFGASLIIMNLSVQHNKCSDKTYREKFGQGRHQSTSLLRGTISKMELLIKPPSLTGEQSAHARMHKCRWWRHEAHSNALVQGKDSLSYV